MLTHPSLTRIINFSLIIILLLSIGDNFVGKPTPVIGQQIDNCQSLPITGVSTNGDDGQNVASNAIDKNMATRWSHFGIGSWIQVDLGHPTIVCSIDIAWYRGNLRQNNFIVSGSSDGINFRDVFIGKSSGTTASFERYNFAELIFPRFIRIIVNGNTENQFADISEVNVNGFGASGPPPPPPPIQTPPTAVVSQSQTVNASSPVNLDGSASFDSDGDSLTYLWTQTAGPTVMLNDSTTAKAMFIAPNVSTSTTLQFQLTVTDTARLTSSAVTTITVIPVTSPPPPPPPPTGVDKFGIKELYPTKQGGEEWFINMNNPNDGRNSAPSLQKNPDGSFKATSTQVRWGIFTSSGFHPDQIATYNQKNLAAKGYMQSPNDWKNVEMTGYLKVNHFTSSTTNGAAHIEFHWRGGRHTSSVPCEGTAYHSNLYETGRAKFEKELEHTAGYTTNDPQILHATNTLDGKWIGIKAVFYNLPNGSVKLEQWLDDRSSNINTPGNDWHKVLEFTDSGSWGGGHPNCGGTPTTIITWGGPIAIFRWDNIDNMDIKNLSVREIQPPQ